jgi:hypothetical protein
VPAVIVGQTLAPAYELIERGLGLRPVAVTTIGVLLLMAVVVGALVAGAT